MYNCDQTLLDRLNSNLQTPAANSDIRPLAYITRNKTAISSQRYWEKQLITPNIGTRSSVAVRRPEGSLLADMIFTTQVIAGNAIIRYAKPKTNLADMTWSVLTTIANVSELSINFDGYMVIDIERVEFYTKGNLPYVFFVDTAGSLKMRNLDNNTGDITISDNAVNVASVRGLYSDAAGLDDGIWVFYTNAAGQLWEARILNGAVSELTQITLLPSGVTTWQDCWAGLTFDYRVVLQLKGNDGKVYTLVSRSRPSGFSMLEYLALTKVKVSGQWGTEPPKLISVETVGVS